MPAGRVIAVIRAYPKDVVEDFAPIIQKINERLSNTLYTLMRWEAIDIAFGYKALDLYFLMPEDIEGGTEQLEELIKSVEGIDNAEVIYITRIGA